MSHFRCWSIRNLLDLYIDHRLAAAWMDRIQAHLGACRTCRAEAQGLEGVVTLLRKSAPVRLPEGLAASIRKGLRSPQPVTQPALRAWDLWRPTPAQVTALAYGLLLALGHTLPGAPTQWHPPPEIGLEVRP